jgi:hypothetical protein
MGAVVTAVLEPIIDVVGIGWTFTIVAMMAVIVLPFIVLLLRKGPAWRDSRKAQWGANDDSPSRSTATA